MRISFIIVFIFYGLVGKAQKGNIDVQWDYPLKGVTSFMIYRAEEGRPLKLYKTITGENFIFVDTSVKIATNYTYVLKANLEDGGSSPFSKEVKIEY